MKKRISFLLAVVMLLAVMIPAIPVYAEEVTNTYTKGSVGTSSNKVCAADITLTTVDDFTNFYNDILAATSMVKFNGYTVTMAQDITLTKAFATTNSGRPAIVCDMIFDGNGKTLSGFTFNHNTNNNTWRNSAALFGCVIGNCEIKDLTMKSYTITGTPSTTETNVVQEGATGGGGFGSLVGNVLQNADNDSQKKTTLKIDGCNLVDGKLDISVNGGTYSAIGGVVGSWRVQGITGYDAQVVSITNTTLSNIALSNTGTGTAYIGSAIGSLPYRPAGSTSDPAHYLTVDFTGSNFGNTNSNTVGVAFNLWGNKGVNGSYREDQFRIYNTAFGKMVDTTNAATEDVATTTANFNTAAASANVNTAPNEKFMGVQKRTDGTGGIRFVGVVKDYKSLETLGFKMTITEPGAEAKAVDVSKTAVTKVYTSAVNVDKPTGYDYIFTFAVTGDIKDGTVFEVSTYSKTGETVCTSTVYSYTYPGDFN